MKLPLKTILLLLLFCSCSNTDEPFVPDDKQPVEEDYEEVKNHFTVVPMPLDKLARITPVGSNNKILPVAHTYWFQCDEPILLPNGFPCHAESVPVVSPGEGIIRRIEGTIDGAISFQVNPTFNWGFSHVDLDPSLQEGDSIHAGDFIGMSHSLYNVDFGVFNTFINHDDLFARPERYPFLMRHSQHPIAQFTPALQEQLKLRIPGPNKNDWGRTSYDVKGTAAGAWFLDSAPRNVDVFISTNEYTQLYLGRLVYLPETRIINSGTPFEKDGVQPVRMVVGADQTDWADITPESGVVQLKIYNMSAEAKQGIYENGSLLIEMTDDETLRIEWFNTHNTISAFTEASRLYVR